METEGTARSVADHRHDLARGDHGRPRRRAVHPDLRAHEGPGQHAPRHRTGDPGPDGVRGRHGLHRDHHAVERSDPGEPQL